MTDTKPFLKGYKPSPILKKFHEAPHQYRHLCCGIKSGKTEGGGAEVVRLIVDRKDQKDQKIAWVVAPTYEQTKTCRLVLDKFLNRYPGLVTNYHKSDKEYTLSNGWIITLKTAVDPDYLRGPNVNIMWIDEAGFVSEECWWVLKGRVAATEGDVFTTTTPPPNQGWYWDELRLGNYPASQEYGIFSDGKLRWVAHAPTWEFPWVKQAFIDECKSSMPRGDFDREYGAIFSDSSSQVFRYIDEARIRDPFKGSSESQYVIGLDLAKHQDFTAVIVMDGTGRVIWVDRWSGVDWHIQKERFKALADEYGAALVMDGSNVGDSISEDLREDGMQIFPVGMNSPDIKRDLIQQLQIAFEQRSIRIPDARAEWSPAESRALYDELKSYQAKLTTGKRISYSAPKGKHDDLVIALALANWGRRRGLAGGGLTATDIDFGKTEWAKKNRQIIGGRVKRPKIFSDIFGKKRGSLGWGSSGPFWG